MAVAADSHCDFLITERRRLAAGPAQSVTVTLRYAFIILFGYIIPLLSKNVNS